MIYGQTFWEASQSVRRVLATNPTKYFGKTLVATLVLCVY